MDNLYCFKVELHTTNVVRNTARVENGYDSKYIPVEQGFVYVIAGDSEEVGLLFRHAKKIERVGPAYVPNKKPLDDKVREVFDRYKLGYQPEGSSIRALVTHVVELEDKLLAIKRTTPTLIFGEDNKD